MNLDEKIKQLENELNLLKDQKLEKEKNKIIKCGACKKGSKIRNLEFINAHYYVPPYGCTGGDYWNTDDSNSGFICVKCNIRNRLLPKHLIALKYSHFKSIKEEYESEIKEPWVNYI